MGSGERAEKAWRIYYPRLVVYLRHAFPLVAEEAEDLAQDAFERALPRLGGVAAGEEAPWLYAVARNAAIDALRRRRRAAEIGIADGPETDAEAAEDPAADHEAAYEREELRLAVSRTIAALPPADRELCFLYYFEGLGTARVAALVGRPEGTVKYRLFRIRAQVKDALQKGGGGAP